MNAPYLILALAATLPSVAAAQAAARSHPEIEAFNHALDCNDIQVSGACASEWCTEHQIVVFPDGKRFDGRGKMLFVLHRGAGGKWRVHDEMWNQAANQ